MHLCYPPAITGPHGVARCCPSPACCRQQLASEAAKSETAAAAAAEAAAVWQEVLMQTEEDLELQAERDGDRLAAARHEAGEVRSSKL
jgi:hypothetical protein